MVSARPDARPRILDYGDYRKFLSDVYQFKKNLRAGFSYRRFSQMAGLSSPNYLQLVMHGKRNLSEAMAEQVARALGLEGNEKQYFVALVARDNARSTEQIERAQLAILRALKSLVSKEIPRAQLNVLTRWYHLLVRELVVLPDFEPSGEWISRKLRGWITESEAERSLAALVRSGFVKVESGRHRQADPVLDTGNAMDEVVGMKYHKSTLTAWAEMLESTDRARREFGVLNIPINPARVPEIKERMRRFQDELIGWLQAEEEPTQVVQLGLYLVPVTD